MESQASGSGSAPKSKRPRINFSHVHQEFDQIEILNARKNKNVRGSKCKHCGQSLHDRNSTNLKAHLKSQHPEIHKVILTLDENTLQKVVESQGGSNSPSCTALDLLPRPWSIHLGPGPGSPLDPALLTTVWLGQQLPRRVRERYPLGGRILKITPLLTLQDDDWSNEKQEKSNKFLVLWIGGSTLPILAV